MPVILALPEVEAKGSEVQGHAQLRSKVSEQSGSGRHKTLSLSKRGVGEDGEKTSVCLEVDKLRIRTGRNKGKNGQTYLGLSSLLSSLSPGLLRLWQA